MFKKNENVLNMVLKWKFGLLTISFSYIFQLIDKAREHLGLSDLEKHTEDGGVLHVHIGDALSTSSNIPGGYSGNFKFSIN